MTRRSPRGPLSILLLGCLAAACAGAPPAPAYRAPVRPAPVAPAGSPSAETAGVLEGVVLGPDGRPTSGALVAAIPAPPEVLTWLKQAAIPLSTVEAGHGFADMQPLRDVVGKARVVALGEATHGTREFFQLKHRMLEFLVEQMGFSVFGVEANLPESLVINDHVSNGKGDPAEALAGLRTWTWDTEEILELIRWMRRYNQDPAHTRKVKFYGFDMQSHAAAARGVIRYLQQVDPASAREFGPVFAPLDDDFSEVFYARRPSEAKRATAARLAALIRRFDDRKDAYTTRTSSAAWALMRLSAEVVRQSQESLSAPPPGDFTLRDRFMAENVAALLDLEGPDAKMVIWAHNAHVSRVEVGYDVPPMGSYLSAKLGPDLVVFGFAFNQGSFQAIDAGSRSGRRIVPFTVLPAPDGSLDATLAHVGQPSLALDLRRASAGGPVAEWLDAGLGTRFIGAAFSDTAPNALARLFPKQSYDALLFVDKTTAARPNLTARAWRPPPPQESSKLAALTNAGMEEGTPGQAPSGWFSSSFLLSAPYQMTLSEQKPKTGKRCGFIGRDRAPYPGGVGALAQRIDATPLRGKRIELRAMVRAEVLGPGNEAQLFLQAKPALQGGEIVNPFSTLAIAHMPDHPIVDRAWRLYQVAMDVPEEADEITLGLVLTGNGRAWVDDVSLQVSGDAAKAEAAKAR